jgi:hypothetical protein
MGKISEVVGVSPSEKQGDSSGEDDVDKELDRELKNIEKEEIRQGKLSKLRVFRLENEVKARELEEKLDSGKSSSSSKRSSSDSSSDKVTPIDIETASELSKLPEEERKKILSILPLLKMNPSNGDNSMLMAMMLMPLIQSSSSKSGEDQVVTTLKVLQAAKELAKSDSGGLKFDFANVLTAIAKLQEKKGDPALETAIQELIKRGLNPPQSQGFLDEVANDEKKLSLLQRFFGKGDQVEMIRLQKELRDSDRKWELAMKKFDRDYELEIEKLKTEREKSQRIENVLRRVTSAVESALSEEGLSLGSGSGVTGTVEKSTSTVPSPPKEGDRLVTTICPKEGCGNRLTYKAGDVGKTVTCIKCGSVYSITPEEQPPPPSSSSTAATTNPSQQK